MDPLILIIEEIDRMRRDLDKLETELTDCEMRIDFQPDNQRYLRLRNEKELVLKNLCDIRKELLQKAIDMQGNAIYAARDHEGNVSYFTGKAPGAKNVPLPPAPAYGGGTYASSSSAATAPRPYAINITEPLSTERKKVSPTDLPDLPEYLQAKANLSSVMREFTDNKIHFVGLDNHVIAMAEYQSISKFTKSGEDPAKFMKGESRTYKTGYNKKTNSFTENRLFIPEYRPYPAGVVPEETNAKRAMHAHPLAQAMPVSSASSAHSVTSYSMSGQSVITAPY